MNHQTHLHQSAPAPLSVSTWGASWSSDSSNHEIAAVEPSQNPDGRWLHSWHSHQWCLRFGSDFDLMKKSVIQSASGSHASSSGTWSLGCWNCAPAGALVDLEWTGSFATSASSCPTIGSRFRDHLMTLMIVLQPVAWSSKYPECCRSPAVSFLELKSG